MIKLYRLLALLLITGAILSGCSKQEESQAQGYIEGKYIYLGASFPGKLTQLNVDRGTVVKAGQLLFILESEPENSDVQTQQEQVAQAKAIIIQAEAALKLAKIDLKRKKTLVKKGTIQQATLDEAQATYDQNNARKQEAVAQIAGAKAGLEKASWAKTQKTVSAIESGYIFDTYYSPGEIVPAGQPVASLLTPQNVKAIFYLSESLLSQVKLASPVTISCDRCANSITANISYISSQPEYTPPVIFSTDTRTKLVYRIEADFKPEVAMQLHPGQPITVDFK